MKKEIENVKSLGVTIETNVIVGKSVTIDELPTEEGFLPYSSAPAQGFPSLWNPRRNANGVSSLQMNI